MALRSSAVDRWAVDFVAAPGCLHEHLFGQHYQRANRLNSTKILRCFPHCCPHHVTRSYCGSPLHVRVSHGQNNVDARQLQVIAHFRDSRTPAAQVGNPVALSALRGSLQSEENTSGEWISSELIGPVDAGTLMFEINPSKRWYYAWRSTRRNEDRLRSHVLEVIVVTPDEVPGHARVLAAAVSPPFTITSFRRFNPNSPLNREIPLTALEASLMALVTASPTSTPPEPAVASSPPPGQQPSSSQSPGELETFQTDLALLMSSISGLRLPRGHELVPRWDDAAMVSATDDTMVSKIGVWLGLDRHIHEVYEQHASQASHAFLDLQQLGTIYAEWMQWLRAHIEDFLQSTGHSWREIIHAATVKRLVGEHHSLPHVFDWENFVARARQHILGDARGHHNGHTSTAFQTKWTTTLGAVSFAKTRQQNQPTQFPSRSQFSTGDLPLGAAIAFTLQLSSVVLTLDLSSAMPTLWIRSAYHDRQTRNRPREATRLLLDGRYRSFNSLPHGESALCAGSVLGGQCFGDYVGVVNAESQRVEVVCFSWPTDLWRRMNPTTEAGVNSVACRWSWSLPLSFVDAETVVVEVEVSTALVAGVGNDGLECESVGSRLGLVEGDWEEAYKVRCIYRRTASTTEVP